MRMSKDEFVNRFKEDMAHKVKMQSTKWTTELVHDLYRLKEEVNNSQVSRHKKAQFFRGSGYFVCSQYKASASLGVSILSVPCGLFVL